MKLALSVTDVLNDSGNEFFPKGVAIRKCPVDKRAHLR